MKIKWIITLSIVCSFYNHINAQKMVNTTVKYDVEDQELQDLLQFQNIAIDNYEFNSPEIEGRSYQVFIKEFKQGDLKEEKLLFNGTELSQFKIDGNKLSFKIFTQPDFGRLKIQLKHRNYSGPSLDFKLYQESNRYVAKGFFDSNKNYDNSLESEFALFTIVTPTVLEDGSSSYCEVVQSGIPPEKLGQHFEIPHYFLITIKFI